MGTSSQVTPAPDGAAEDAIVTDSDSLAGAAYAPGRTAVRQTQPPLASTDPQHAPPRLSAALLPLGVVVALAPLVAAVVGGLWSIVVSLRALYTIARAALHGNFAAASRPLPQIDLAGHLGTLTGGYLVVFCALIVLMTGLLGRRWRRLLILPGVLLLVPGLLAFVYGLEGIGGAPAWHIILAIYALLDAVLLAAVLPGRRTPKLRAPADTSTDDTTLVDGAVEDGQGS